MTCQGCGGWIEEGVTSPPHACTFTTGAFYYPAPGLGIDARTGRCHTILSDGFRCHGEQGHLGGCWRWAEV